jgi:hypothetical protein
VPRNRRGAARIEDLLAQMRDLVAEGTRVLREVPEGPRPRPAVRLKALQHALAKGDLEKVRALVPDRPGNAKQRTLVYVYACILETNSAGLGILRDRFSAGERRRIAAALRVVGATRTRASQLRMEKRRLSAIEPPTERLVREMEEKLLAFCRAHAAELAKR